MGLLSSVSKMYTLYKYQTYAFCKYQTHSHIHKYQRNVISTLLNFNQQKSIYEISSLLANRGQMKRLEGGREKSIDYLFFLQTCWCIMNIHIYVSHNKILVPYCVWAQNDCSALKPHDKQNFVVWAKEVWLLISWNIFRVLCHHGGIRKQLVTKSYWKIESNKNTTKLLLRCYT